MDLDADTRIQYAHFAADARDYSPCFDEWASGVAADDEVLAWLERLPEPKRQPNLVFAAARWHGVAAPGPYAGLRAALLDDDGTIEGTILARSTQTNEVGRLATLVPAFSLAVGAGPVALLEVGASAGLNLYPDRWSYTWTTGAGAHHAGVGPELGCEVSGPAPLPTAPPTVAWRGGVDLHPLDVADEEQMRWLSFLVWPEHDERRARLAQAVDIARIEPPELVTGDLLEELPALVERAAAHAPVVVFHSAVVTYLSPESRARFQELMAGLVAGGRCHWVSNEGETVLPEVTATANLSDDELDALHGFVLGLDGRAVALTHGHGRWLRWL